MGIFDFLFGKKAKPVATPQPQGFQSYGPSGQLQSSLTYDQGSNSYQSKTFETPEEKQNREQRQSLYQGFLGRLNGPDKSRQDQLNSYEGAWFNRAAKPLQDQYQQSSNTAREAFNSRGMLASSGYEDYRKRNLDDVLYQGLQSAGQDATMAREQLQANDLANALAGLGALEQGNEAANVNQQRLGQYGLSGLGTGQDIANNQFINRLRANQDAQSRSSKGLLGMLGF